MSEDYAKQVRVGVGAIIVRDGKFLLHKRIGSHGSDTWSPLGGYQEYGESPIDTARREAIEEAGITAIDTKVIGFTNDLFEVEGKHHITIHTIALAKGEPRIVEPDKCQEMGWFALDEMPDNVFLPLKNLLDDKVLRARLVEAIEGSVQ